MWVQFRYRIPGIGFIRNQLKLQELNWIPELRGITANQWDFIGTEFRELDRAGSVDGTDSAMFNIVEYDDCSEYRKTKEKIADFLSSSMRV